MLKEKTLDGLSIGFVPTKAKNTKGGVRIIEELDLWEISVVSFPAANKARIQAVRSLPSESDLRAFIDTVRKATLVLRQE